MIPPCRSPRWGYRPRNSEIEAFTRSSLPEAIAGGVFQHTIGFWQTVSAFVSAKSKNTVAVVSTYAYADVVRAQGDPRHDLQVAFHSKRAVHFCALRALRLRPVVAAGWASYFPK